MTLPLRAADALVRIWVRLYTWRLPLVLRERRRAEIESDLWESLHDDEARSDLAQAVHIVLRLAAGIPDDLFWRFEQPREEKRLSRRAVAAVGFAATAMVVATGFWFLTIVNAGELPKAPAAPSTWLAFPGFRPAPPPPPPPPPPPGTRLLMRGDFLPPPPPPPPDSGTIR